MTTPFLYSGRLQTKAKQLGVNLKTAKNQKKSEVYYATVKGIRDELYKEETAGIAKSKSFLKILEKDMRQINHGIRLLEEKKYSDFSGTRDYLDSAYGQLSLALSLFEGTEETDAVKRIQSRIDAIIRMRRKLDKAILQWPSEI